MHKEEKNSLVLLGALLVVGIVAYSVNASAKSKSAKAPAIAPPVDTTKNIYRVAVSLPKELSDNPDSLKQFLDALKVNLPSARLENGDLVFETVAVTKEQMRLEVGKYFQVDNYSFLVKSVNEVIPDD